MNTSFCVICGNGIKYRRSGGRGANYPLCINPDCLKTYLTFRQFASVPLIDKKSDHDAYLKQRITERYNGFCGRCGKPIKLDFRHMFLRHGTQSSCEAAPTSRKQLKKEQRRNRITWQGGCRPNPGAMRIAYVINNKGYSTTLAIGTNNIAEYTALITGLKECIKKEYKEIIVRGDSLLVVKQMLGERKIKDMKLTPLNTMAKLLCKKVKVNFEWIPREQNLAGKILED